MLAYKYINIGARASPRLLRDVCQGSDPEWAHLMGLGGRQLGHPRVGNPSGYYWPTHKCLTWTCVGSPACILGPTESQPKSSGGRMTLADFFGGTKRHVRATGMRSRGHDLGPQGWGIPSRHYIGNYQRLT